MRISTFYLHFWNSALGEFLFIFRIGFVVLRHAAYRGKASPHAHYTC